MAPLSTNAISHFMHPSHKVNHRITNDSYICDGCKVLGTGSRFTCTVCSFDLHDYCAMCPPRLTATTNHRHPMSLVVHEPEPNITQSCKTCLNPIKGLAYNCKDCNFWVHPLCVSVSVSVSGNSGHSGAFSSCSVGSAAQQIGIGLAQKGAYDLLKAQVSKHDDPSVGSNAWVSHDEVPLFGAGEVYSTSEDTSSVDEGFFSSMISGLQSLFESSFDS